MWDSMPSSSYLYTPEEGRTMAWKTKHGRLKGRSVRSMKRSIRTSALSGTSNKETRQVTETSRGHCQLNNTIKVAM